VRHRAWTEWRYQRWVLAAAVVLFAIIPLTRDRDDAEPDTLRGGGLLLLEPIGEVTSVSQFRWHTDLLVDTFYVEVRNDDGVVYAETLRTMSFVPPADLQQKLVPGRYRWRVIARDASRATLVTAPVQTFVITP
jgi:hypothetical protein